MGTYQFKNSDILIENWQDSVVLWSKSSTLDWKVEGSNPAAANFSFEVDDLDA